MAILIADSGSTKTDWCLADDGHETGRVLTQGINPFHQSEEEIERIVTNELVTQLGTAQVSGIFFYGSGCRSELCPMVERVLRRAFPQATTVEVNGDLLGAARAVCGRSEGIACILGTGANSCLYDGQRITANTPPLGYILGDEGSGAVLGVRFVNALYKGTLPDGLREEFEQEMSLTMGDVIGRVYRQPLANRFLASLSPFIHQHLYIKEVKTLVEDNFRDFFRRNVEPYGRHDLAIGFVGSIACHYSDQLKAVAQSEGYSVGAIVKNPISRLVEYHF